MATQITFNYTGIAGAALLMGQFVKFDGSGELIPCSVAGEEFLGVVASGSHAAGDPEVLVAVAGETLVLCEDADVTALSLVRTAADGTATLAAAGDGDAFVARSMQGGRAAGPDDEVALVRILLPFAPVEIAFGA